MAATGDGRVEVRQMNVRADELLMTSTGHVVPPEDPEVPLIEGDLTVELDMAVRGDMAKLFDGLRLLEDGEPDEQGFRHVAEPFVIEGTLAEPDASQLWETLDAGIDHAHGAWGRALRGARKRFLKSLEQSEP
jgi:hypothetical protein